MTINPFCSPLAAYELAPESIVYALRRGGPDRKLSGCCYTDPDGTLGHPWLDIWAGRATSTKLVPLTFRAYLTAHLNEIEGTDAQEHARVEFLRRYRERWGLDGGDADVHADMTAAVTDGEAS